MLDMEKVIKGLELCTERFCDSDCPYYRRSQMIGGSCTTALQADALALLKKQINEYEKGFNDAMFGKQELMYEGEDGKWYMKDW